MKRLLGFVVLFGCGTVVIHGQDAGVDAALGSDGATDASHVSDAFVADQAAPADASTIVTSGEAADLVLGQADFISSWANENGPESAQTLGKPCGLAAVGGRLWAFDRTNRRVLDWSTTSLVSNAAADSALGQSSMIASSTGPTDILLGSSARGGVFSDGTRIFVADSDDNRVLIWNTIPTGSGVPADLVLGQTTFTDSGAGSSLSQMADPQGLWSDGRGLVVADSLNHRVLFWNSIPTVSGQAADFALGSMQASVTATSMNRPVGVTSDGKRLFVADQYDNRILVWNQWPASNAPADYVLGQPDMTSSAEGGGASGLSNPTEILLYENNLFVSDTLNDRVLVFAPVPSQSGMPATLALGQPDADTTTKQYSPTTTTIGLPEGLAVSDSALFVSDGTFNRVLRFELAP